MTHLLKCTTLLALLAGAIFCTPLAAHADRGGDTSPSDQRSNGGREVHRRATIVGTALSPAARGTAESEAKSTGESELEVKVTSLNLRAGTVVSISVDGINLGTARVTRGRISFKARGTTVPVIGIGSNVVLQTSDGAIVASGSF